MTSKVTIELEPFMADLLLDMMRDYHTDWNWEMKAMDPDPSRMAEIVAKAISNFEKQKKEKENNDNR